MTQCLEYKEHDQLKEMDCPHLFTEWVEQSQLINKYPVEYDKLMVAISNAEPGNFWFWCGKLMTMHGMVKAQNLSQTITDDPIELAIHLTLIAKGLSQLWEDIKAKEIEISSPQEII